MVWSWVAGNCLPVFDRDSLRSQHAFASQGVQFLSNVWFVWVDGCTSASNLSTSLRVQEQYRGRVIVYFCLEWRVKVSRDLSMSCARCQDRGHSSIPSNWRPCLPWEGWLSRWGSSLQERYAQRSPFSEVSVFWIFAFFILSVAFGGVRLIMTYSIEMSFHFSNRMFIDLRFCSGQMSLIDLGSGESTTDSSRDIFALGCFEVLYYCSSTTTLDLYFSYSEYSNNWCL